MDAQLVHDISVPFAGCEHERGLVLFVQRYAIFLVPKFKEHAYDGEVA